MSSCLFHIPVQLHQFSVHVFMLISYTCTATPVFCSCHHVYFIYLYSYTCFLFMSSCLFHIPVQLHLFSVHVIMLISYTCTATPGFCSANNMVYMKKHDLYLILSQITCLYSIIMWEKSAWYHISRTSCIGHLNFIFYFPLPTNITY